MMRLTAHIMSQQLDRSKPLWELWVVEGLEDRGFALISKTHHAMVDGISGVDLATVMFDLSPVPNRVDREPWTPQPEPSQAELIAEGAKSVAKLPFGIASRATQALTHPRQTLASAGEALEGVGEVAWAGLNPAPETPLNVPIGPHRRVAFVHSELADFKLIKNTFGGDDVDVHRQRVVHASDERRRRQRDGQIRVRDLTQRVDAGVRPSRSVRLDSRRFRRFAERTHQFALHGPRIFLNLPAAVAGAGVFEGELVAGHV